MLDKNQDRTLFSCDNNLIQSDNNAIQTREGIIPYLLIDLESFLMDKKDLGDEKINKQLQDYAKIFHTDFLLKEFNYNDANILNENFYKELLYLLGLHEVNKQGKILILPSKESKTRQGTLYYNIMERLYKKYKIKLEPAEEINEQAFEILILWINRILFLKLLEASLLNFSENEKPFLNFETIKDYDTLNDLFFQILAKNHNERQIAQIDDLIHLPYLNSSLFIRDESKENMKAKLYGQK